MAAVRFFLLLCLQLSNGMDLCLDIPLCLFQAFMQSFASLWYIYIYYYEVYIFLLFFFNSVSLERSHSFLRYGGVKLISIFFGISQSHLLSHTLSLSRMESREPHGTKIEQINHLEIFITELRSNLVVALVKWAHLINEKEIANAQTFLYDEK